MEKRKHYLVYQVSNLLNGKVYIGQHVTDNVDDGYMGSGNLIRKAIKKYGIENFKKEILFDFDSEEEMNQKEVELVDEIFVRRKDTYNLTIGGYAKGFYYANKVGVNNKSGQCYRTGELLKTDVEFRQRFCENISNGLKRFYSTHPGTFSGKSHSSQTKKKLSRAKKGKNLGKENPSFGKHWWKNPNNIQESRMLCDSDVPSGWIRGRW